ncbi:MAG TPA: tRNA (adenosine(37)-N6)-threonylcarbamoyltransferase complex dimerization subunit type 1 TsaB [Planctomycetota bacterium]|nr:tRNA (adenosine(37)-N6)-threonylcarbamoyltransferase complex dimerization subunit type 1 TsaB [Planctomycetota bacterium]
MLGIESSGPRGGVALLDEARLLGEALFEAGMVHGREIAPAADRLLREAGKRPADLDLIAVDIGPGSYTGLRVGLAAAKGLSFALGRPLIGVASLDVLAEAAAAKGLILAPALDAKWDQVYGALYEVRNGRPVRITEMFAEAPEAFAARVPRGALVVGDALERHAALFAARGAVAAPRDLWTPKPARVAALGLRRHAEGGRDDVATLVPLYLRKTEAEEKFGPK